MYVIVFCINNDAFINDKPAKKKQKKDTNGINDFKFVLSIDDKPDRFKSKFKSLLKPNEKVASTRNEEVPMEIDCEESTLPQISPTPFGKTMWPKCPLKMMPSDKFP